MQLYSGTASDFIAAAKSNKIALQLKQAFIDKYHSNPGINEVHSWANSLQRISNVIEVGGLADSGVILEYQLPLSGSRLDCMLTGTDGQGTAQATVVELKQWSKVEPSNAEGNVVTYVGGAKRDVLHPSQQVWQYQQYLEDVHTVFSSGDVGLCSCAYLHNLPYDPSDETFSERHKAILAKAPVFGEDQQDLLIQYLAARLSGGYGIPVLDKVLASKYAPSKKLLDHTAKVIADQPVYVLLDDQQAVFSKVMAEVKAAAARPVKKTVFVIRGGPGTGKSVIALHLVGALSAAGLNVMHLTGSKAFTESMKKVVGPQAAALFKYFNLNKKGDVPPNQFDALILDEAHRIRKDSKDQWFSKDLWSGIPQIDELLSITKVAVFFIDDKQIVRPKEVGSTTLLHEAAKAHNAAVEDYELETQFRCLGSDGFINWVDNTLGIRKTANGLWDRNDKYEVKAFDSVQALEAAIRAKNQPGQTARLVAGYCWPWSKPKPDGTLIPDVSLDGWAMPWNAKPDAGRLAKGIPKANFWASDPGGLEQVGCVYTAQGFEFDYVGVIFGKDLRYDPAINDWVGDYEQSCDGLLRTQGRRNFTEFVKNTYRVLLTRGMKGCFIYFQDEATRRFFEYRMQ